MLRRWLGLATLGVVLAGGCVPRQAVSRHPLSPPPAGGTSSAEVGRVVEDRCIRVIDGDTIHTQRHGALRLIGINAQEHGEPTYVEARNFVAAQVNGKQVRLEICPITPKDRYGRTRAVVYFRHNGKWVNLNRLAVSEGWARISDYQPCHIQAAKEWQGDEDEAKRLAKGIWASSTARVGK